jgi:hypothetical protein
VTVFAAALARLRRSARWRSVRRAHLKQEPACVACGRVRWRQVHHEKPFHLDPELELDPSNLITLCQSPLPGGPKHHLQYGHAGNWSRSVPTVRRDAEAARERLALSRLVPRKTPRQRVA